MKLVPSPGWAGSHAVPVEAHPGGKAGSVGPTSPAPRAVLGIDGFILWIRQET